MKVEELKDEYSVQESEMLEERRKKYSGSKRFKNFGFDEETQTYKRVDKK